MLNKFGFRMVEHLRQEIIEGGVKGYENKLERDLAGVCPLYTAREWNREEMDKKKNIKRVANQLMHFFPYCWNHTVAQPICA